MKRKPTVLVLADAMSPELLRGIDQYALIHPHLSVHIHLIEYGRVSDLRQMGKVIAQHRPDGVVAPVAPENRRAMERLRVPVVNYYDQVHTRVPTVMYDQAAIGRLAGEHLIAQGLRQFAYASIAHGYCAHLRWEGFAAAVREAGFPCHLFDDAASGRKGLAISDALLGRWLAGLPKPVGIHVAYTALAMKVVSACKEFGLSVPGDVAVIGGQDAPHLTTNWQPTISAFTLPRERVAYECMALLDRLMQGAERPTAPVVLPPGPVIQRQSTDVRGSRDPVVAEALNVIRAHAHSPFSVKELMQHIPLSRRTLENRFQSVMGRTLHDEINRVHMERAMTLLARSTLSIEQVALQSGFSGSKIFSTAFRQHAGMTPTEYRGKTGVLA